MKEKKIDIVKEKIKSKNYSFFQSIFRVVLFLYYKIIRLNSSPEDIARGLALGVFVGFLPLLPIQTVAAVFLATVFKANKFTAAMGTWVSNPLNFVFLYVLYHSIGTCFIPIDPTENTLDVKSLDALDSVADNPHEAKSTIHQLFKSGPRFIAAMFLGGAVIAIPAALITYFVSLHALRVYRNNKSKKAKNRELNKIRKLQESIAKDREE